MQNGSGEESFQRREAKNKPHKFVLYIAGGFGNSFSLKALRMKKIQCDRGAAEETLMRHSTGEKARPLDRSQR
eukprot:5130806-Pleurochrysis_carterae.AAC.4